MVINNLNKLHLSYFYGRFSKVVTLSNRMEPFILATFVNADMQFQTNEGRPKDTF